MSTIKKEIRTSFIWNAIENFSRMGVQFIIGVILARLLNASDYGILGIISVFIAVSQTLIDAGFSNALLQKKECSNDDYSTVFWVNTAIGVLIFIILFFTAPFISDYYESPVLADILPVMGLSLVVQSLYTVNKVKLTKELKFKQLAYIAFFTSVLSGIIAIGMAYTGCGVWALIGQSVISIVLSGLVIVYLSKWFPKFLFSRESFDTMFNFGSKLLVSNILYTVFNNIYNLVIGKCFQPAVLGYFTRADGYAKLIPNNISGILQNIMLPVLSKQQDDIEGLRRVYIKFIKITSIFIFPLTLLFAVLARPIILLMLTSKWENSIPLLQILCIASLFDHILSINNNYLMVKGKSDYILYLSVSSKVFLVVALIFSFNYGIIAVALSKVAYSLVTFIISAYFFKKTFSMRILEAVYSSFPIISVSVATALYAYLLNIILPMAWWSLILTGMSSLGLYYLLSSFFLKEEVQLVKTIKK